MEDDEGLKAQEETHSEEVTSGHDMSVDTKGE